MKFLKKIGSVLGGAVSQSIELQLLSKRVYSYQPIISRKIEVNILSETRWNNG